MYAIFFLRDLELVLVLVLVLVLDTNSEVGTRTCAFGWGMYWATNEGFRGEKFYFLPHRSSTGTMSSTH